MGSEPQRLNNLGGKCAILFVPSTFSSIRPVGKFFTVFSRMSFVLMYPVICGDFFLFSFAGVSDAFLWAPFSYLVKIVICQQGVSGCVTPPGNPETSKYPKKGRKIEETPSQLFYWLAKSFQHAQLLLMCSQDRAHSYLSTNPSYFNQSPFLFFFLHAPANFLLFQLSLWFCTLAL